MGRDGAVGDFFPMPDLRVERPQFPLMYVPFWRDDVLLLSVQDDAGTVMAKRFRFRLPQQGQ